MEVEEGAVVRSDMFEIPLVTALSFLFLEQYMFLSRLVCINTRLNVPSLAIKLLQECRGRAVAGRPNYSCTTSVVQCKSSASLGAGRTLINTKIFEYKLVQCFDTIVRLTRSACLREQALCALPWHCCLPLVSTSFLRSRAKRDCFSHVCDI